MQLYMSLLEGGKLSLDISWTTYKKSWICVVLASICGNFPAVGDVYMMDSEWLFQPFCYIHISSFLDLVYQVYINY